MFVGVKFCSHVHKLLVILIRSCKFPSSNSQLLIFAAKAIFCGVNSLNKLEKTFSSKTKKYLDKYFNLPNTGGLLKLRNTIRVDGVGPMVQMVSKLVFLALPRRGGRQFLANMGVT